MTDKPMGVREALTKALAAMLVADHDPHLAFAGWLEKFGFCIAPLMATPEMCIAGVKAMDGFSTVPEPTTAIITGQPRDIYAAAIGARPKVGG